MENVVVLIVLAVILVPIGLGVYVSWYERQLPEEQRPRSRRARRRAERYVDPFDPVEMERDFTLYVEESLRRHLESATPLSGSDFDGPSDVDSLQPLTPPSYWDQIVELQPEAAAEALFGSVEVILIPLALDPPSDSVRRPGWVAFTDRAIYVAAQRLVDPDGSVEEVLRMPIDSVWPVIQDAAGRSGSMAVRLFHIEPALHSLVQRYIDSGTPQYQAIRAYSRPDLGIGLEIQDGDVMRFTQVAQASIALRSEGDNDGRY